MLQTTNFSDFLLGLLQVLHHVVFTLFLSDRPRDKQHDHSNNKKNDGSGSSNNCEENTDDDLQAAFRYFEIATPSEATRDSVKKMYKRLSRIHHPDRNENSKESNEKMQKINWYYELLEKEFDRLEGIVDNGDYDIDHDDKRKKNRKSQNRDPNEPGISAAERKRRGNMQRREQTKARKQREAEIREERRRMEEEMQREWQEARRHAAELKKKQQKMAKQKQKIRKESRRKSKNANLETKKGRDEAHNLWTTSVQKYQERIAKRTSASDEDLHGIDDDSGGQASNITLQSHQVSASIEKPKNPIMEHCSIDVAVALRMGETEITIEIIHDGIGSTMNEWVTEKLMEKLRDGKTPDTKLEVDDSFNDAILNTLLSAMDHDGNNIFHYAVYMEDNQVISYLVDEARKVNRFAEFIVGTNDRGQSALDFSIVCTKDPTIPGRVQAFWDEAHEIIENRKLGPSFRLFVSKLVPRDLTSLEPTLYTICALMVGRRLFECGWFMSFLIAGGAHSLEDQFGAISMHLFTLHLIWHAAKGALLLLWTLCGMLFPTWLFCRAILALLSCFALQTPVFAVANSVVWVNLGILLLSVAKVVEILLFSRIREDRSRRHRQLLFMTMTCFAFIVKLVLVKLLALVCLNVTEEEALKPMDMPVPSF